MSQASIRDQLEQDFHQRYPLYGQKMAQHHRPYRSLRWQDRTLLVTAVILMALLLLRVETAQAQDDLFGLQLTVGAQQHTAVALNTDVDIEITGLSARVWVTQRFRNDANGWAEGIYRFPLPFDAAVDRMRIVVGDRILEGEIQEKKSARRVYEAAREAGQTASIVEQQRPNQFETRVANIGPGEEVAVKIGFLQRVMFDDGEFSLRLPTTFTPRWEPAPEQATEPTQGTALTFVARQHAVEHHVTFDIRLNAGMSLAFLESRYHDLEIHPLADHEYFLSSTQFDTRLNKDFELVWAPDFSSDPKTRLLTYQDDQDIYALLMVVPPAAQHVSDVTREVIFIIDTSGSMAGSSIRQAKSALLHGLDRLRPQDFFNIIEFNNQAHALFDQPVGANGAALKQARQYIRGLEVDGGTVMAPALEQALGFPSQPDSLRQVIFITDGSVGNEAELFKQIAEQLDETRLFTIAIGSAPNTYFMRKAAEIGRGTFTHIGQQQEVEERMLALWDKIQRPALTNISVDWGMAAETYPEIVPDLYAGEPLWLSAKLEQIPDSIVISADRGRSAWSEAVVFDPDSDQAAQSSILETLWAKSKISALEDSLLFGFDPQSIRQNITLLALQYQLLTPYTAMIAVDKTPVRPAADALNSYSIGSLLPAGSGAAVDFAATATGWQLSLLIGLLLLAACLAVCFRAGFTAVAPTQASHSSINVAR